MNKRNHRKLVAMQHEEAQRQKEELNQMKFRFFTNISHELRTPLTLIITPLEILKRKIADESVNRQLNTIYRNAQELLTLVNQLLDFRKLEMKGEKLLLMNGDLEEFVTSVYNSFCPVAVEKKLDFTCRIPHQSLYMYLIGIKYIRLLIIFFPTHLSLPQKTEKSPCRFPGKGKKADNMQ